MTRPRKGGVNEQSAPVGWYWCIAINAWRHPVVCRIHADAKSRTDCSPRCEHRKEKHETKTD
jgi:hypothetical protein